MQIRFQKAKDGSATLSCIRDDGSSTWSNGVQDFFVWHDLIHYAVETTLGCRQAFFGLLASGWNIDDFEKRDPKTGRTPPLPAETVGVENIVGLLSSELVGAMPPSHAEFSELLASACAGFDFPPPAVTPEQLDAIRAAVAALHSRWRDLPPGGVLELPFPTP